MKNNPKLKIAIIIIAVIIVIGAITIFVVNKIKDSKRDYQIEQILEDNYFVVKTNDKYGVMDRTGKIIIDATYDNVKIPNPSKEIFICYQGEKGIALNTNKQQLYAEYNSVMPIELKDIAYDYAYEKSVLVCEKNGKYGLIDFDGKQIVDTIYDGIESFANIEGQLQIKQNDKYGVMNIRGNVLVKPEYDEVISDNYYSEENDYKYSGYIVGIKEEDGCKYGYIDYKGKKQLEIEYNNISRILEIQDEKTSYLRTAKNGQYGLQQNGKTIIENQYQNMEYDSVNKIFLLLRGENYGIAGLDGKEIIPVQNDNVEIKGKYIYVENGDNKSVYDVNGQKVDVEFNQTIIDTENDNYKIIINADETNNYYGIIDKDNNQVINAEYLYIEYAYGDYFIACGQNGKLGVLDKNGKTILDFKYDLVQKLQNKNIIQALISDINTTELYSEKMQKICEMENATINNQENYIMIYSDTKMEYYNNDGSSISSVQVYPKNTLFAKCEDGKWGFIDSAGNVKVNYEYDTVKEFNEYGFASVQKEDKWGCIDTEGNVIVEPKYSIDESYNDIEFIGQYIRVVNGYGVEYYTNDIL